MLPEGFQADVFAEKVENARAMVLGPQGTVFVGSRTAGKVHAVVDRDGDHKADSVVVVASGLESAERPRDAERRAVCGDRESDAALRRHRKHLDAPPTPVTVREDLAEPEAGHTWKFIAFGPDDLLYMSVGAPCNVCLRRPWCRRSCG